MSAASLDSLRRLLGAVETHSITTEAAAERGDLPRVELYLQDCREAHDRLVVATAGVIVSSPCTPEAREAHRIAGAAGDLLGRALLAQLHAWSRNGGNPRSYETEAAQ